LQAAANERPCGRLGALIGIEPFSPGQDLASDERLIGMFVANSRMPDMPNGDEQLACNSHNGEVLMLVAAKLLKLFLPIRAVLHGGTSGFDEGSA
jgi:hypothetical protein